MPNSVADMPKGFVVTALTLLESHLLRLTLDDPLLSPTEKFRYQFKTACTVLFNANQPEQVRVDVRVDATARPARNGKNVAKARLIVAVIFHYDELATLRSTKGLPLELAWTSVSIAYSTVRGILQARLAGTSFDKALLPIISPQRLWQPPKPPSANILEEG